MTNKEALPRWVCSTCGESGTEITRRGAVRALEHHILENHGEESW
jgi:hypothetical protein